MQLTPLIAFHVLAALAATVLGPFVIWARLVRHLHPRLHRHAGRVWVGLMLAAAVSAAAIRDFSLPNLAGYTPIYLLVPTVLISFYFSVRAIRRGDVVWHRRLMLFVYIGGCIVAGALSLLPGRYLGKQVSGMLDGVPLAAVLAGTPGWVWLVLAALVVLGARRLRPSSAGRTRVLLWPVLMTGGSLAALVGNFGLALPALAAWAAGFALLAGTLARGGVSAGTRYDAATRLWHLPASGVPLLLMLALFASRYVTAATLGWQPGLASSLVLQMVAGAALGTFSGSFAGVGLRLWRMAQAATPRRLAARRVAAGLAAAGALVASASAEAGVGLATLARTDWGASPVTLFYPSASPDAEVVRAPFRMQLAKGGVPPAGNGRLVVISHGSGGSPHVNSLDPDSLAAPQVPVGVVGVVGARQDRWLVPALHSGVLRRACASRCTLLADLAVGGHGALLSPLPPDLPAAARPLLADPPGFDRGVVPAVHARIAAFFVQHLLG